MIVRNDHHKYKILSLQLHDKENYLEFSAKHVLVHLMKSYYWVIIYIIVRIYVVYISTGITTRRRILFDTNLHGHTYEIMFTNRHVQKYY